MLEIAPRFDLWIREHHMAWRRITGRARKRPKPARAAAARPEEPAQDPRIAWCRMNRQERIEATHSALCELYRPGEVVSVTAITERLGARRQTVCNLLNLIETKHADRWLWRRLRDGA